MATHAASMAGHDAIIISQARKSFLRGAQYLHRPIPLATATEPFRVTYDLLGSAEEYRRKVYTPDYRGTVSPEDLTESHYGWDIRTTYDWLWTTYGGFVKKERFEKNEPRKIKQILHWAKADVVISTIPAMLLCYNPGHLFNSQYIWSLGEDEAKEICNPAMNKVLCNGLDAPAWYRMANIQGHVTIEWPDDKKPPLQNLFHVEKPISNTCGCFPEIHRMGRYGRHEKGILSDSAFFQTLDVLSAPTQLSLEGV